MWTQNNPGNFGLSGSSVGFGEQKWVGPFPLETKLDITGSPFEAMTKNGPN